MVGCAAGCLRASADRRLEESSRAGRLDLVGLGQDQMVADRGVVEHLHDVAVDVLQAVARIDQHQRPLEHLPAAQKVVDQEAPALDHVLGRFGEAVAGHVDQPDHQRLADIEDS